MMTVAHPAAATSADLMAADFLACVAAGQQVGLPLTAIAAVIRPGALTPLPLAPAAVLGLLNWQGSALPVFALGRLLSPDHTPDLAQRTARIVILNQPSRFGLWVEMVAGADYKGWSLHALAELLQRSVVLPPSAPDLPTPLSSPASSALNDEQDLLVFSVGAEDYALPLNDIEHVARHLTPALAALPQLALREHWQQAPGPAREWLAVRYGTARVLLVADRLRTILRVPMHALRDIPRVLAAQRSDMREVAAVYAAHAGAQVTVLDLQRLLEGAQISAGAPVEIEEQGMTLRQALEDVLVLRMGAHRFALPLAAAEAVVRMPAQLQPVPGAPAFVRGMLQWRGQSVPVLDYRAMLASAPDQAAIPASARILLLHIGGILSGLLVDEMRDMFTLHADELVEAPALHPLQAQLIKQMAVRAGEAHMLPLLQAEALSALDQAGALAALMAEPA